MQDVQLYNSFQYSVLFLMVFQVLQCLSQKWPGLPTPQKSAVKIARVAGAVFCRLDALWILNQLFHDMALKVA